MYFIRRVVWNVLHKKGGVECTLKEGWCGIYSIRRVVWNVLYKKGGVECTP